MPARLYLRAAEEKVSPVKLDRWHGEDVRIELVLLVIDPARAQGQLLLRVLKILVSVAVEPNQRTGFGVADVLEAGAEGLEGPRSVEGGETDLHLMSGILRRVSAYLSRNGGGGDAYLEAHTVEITQSARNGRHGGVGGVLAHDS